MLCEMCLVTANTSVVVQDNVIFKKLADVHTSQSSWKMTLVEDLDAYTPLFEAVKEQMIHLSRDLISIKNYMSVFSRNFLRDRSNTEAKIIHYYRESFIRMIRGFENLRDTFESLLVDFSDLRDINGTPTLERQRKSIFPFMGNLYSFLFGTVSEDELNAVKRNINALTLSQKRVIHVVNQSLSLINISKAEIGQNRERLNEVIDTMKTFDSELRAIQQALTREVVQIEKMTQTFFHSFSVINDAQANVNKLFRHFEYLQLQLNMLSRGRLSPSVLTPRKLLEILKEIKGKLPALFSLPKDPVTNLWYFYQTLKVATMISEGKILIFVTVPVIEVSSKFEVFQIHNLPVPGKRAFGDHIAKYEIDSLGLAINAERTAYMLLNKEDLTICAASVNTHCELNKPRFEVNAGLHCEIALFMGDTKLREHICAVKVSTKTQLPYPIYLQEGHWAIATNESFRLPICF